METVLMGVTYESCLVYLAYVFMIGRMLREHLHNLRKFFQRFRKARLELSMKNVIFRRKYGNSD
jgi:hypothetical protein